MLSELGKLQEGRSFSICPENFTGEKGGACRAQTGTGAHFSRELGPGYKMSPSIIIKSGEEFVLGKIQGMGEITHMWMTCPVDAWRDLILECYWDGEQEPSVCVPVGDFFCNGWCEHVNINSIPITVAPKGGFNSYWNMPFLKKAKIVMRNLYYEDCVIYYQIDFTEKKLEGELLYFHAQFRRKNPTVKEEPYVILDQVKGCGHYVGTYLAWQSNSCDWWGEGEVKFFLDGDLKYPTICSTGTEDYFGGAYNFEHPKGEYCSYTAPFLGFAQMAPPDGLYASQQRFGMYRWHIYDKIQFEKDIRVQIQPLGVRYNQKYLLLQEDIASVAVWYQTEPHVAFPMLPDENERYVTRKIDWNK